MQVTWSKCYSNFHQGITAVCQEILCFAEVDPHHADEQMAGCPQTDFHLSGEQMHFHQLLDPLIKVLNSSSSVCSRPVAK